MSEGIVARNTPEGELATLLLVLGPADGRPGRGPVVALPWAPAWAGSSTLLHQFGRRVPATFEHGWRPVRRNAASQWSGSIGGR